MPLNIDWVQILLHMLNFVILFGGLTLLVYRPVCRFMEERRESFETRERENAQKSEENEALRRSYEEEKKQTKAELEEMRRTAEKEAAAAAKACLDDAKEKAQTILTEARREAETRKEQILDSAQIEIGELVVSAAQKLLGDTVTPERNSGLYDEFIRRADQTVTEKRERK